MEVKEWLEKIEEEYNKFKIEMLIQDVRKVYDNYEEIMLYEKVYNYLSNTEDDCYIGITIKDVYDYYINNDVYDIALTDTDQLIKLLDWAYEDWKREKYYKKYEDEYEKFKEQILLNKPEIIFELSGKISFYNAMFAFIQNQEYSDLKEYMKDRTIDELYEKFLRQYYDLIFKDNKDVKLFLKSVE